MKFATCIVLLLFFINGLTAIKILGIFPYAARSHYFLGNELMKGLADAGHDVTMLSVFEEKNPPKNGTYRQLIMDDVKEFQSALFSKMANLSDKTSESMFLNPFVTIAAFQHMGLVLSENLLSNKELQKLVKSKEKFDVVVVPQFTIESMKALATHFGAHLVIFANSALNGWVNHFVGNPNLPSLTSEILLGYTGQMNFQQRLTNTALSIVQYISSNLYIYPKEKKLVHKYISEDIDFYKSIYNVSLLLVNSHVSLNKPQNLVPVMKEIGGFHVKPPTKLPEDLQKYLDEAKDGVIYFSMGSNLRSADIPLNIRSSLIKAFSKRKEKILWKFESDDMPDKPKNVRIEKWLPQADILAHPNVKLFITHGGFLSTIETVYHGIPTIALPILGDQMMNAKLAESYGFTKVLQFKSLTEEVMSAAIEEVLTNNKYRKNVKLRSQLFHDRPVKPLDEAIYWIEYIVKYNGAEHLRVDYLNLSWYQWYLLDVFGFIFGVIFLVLFIIKKSINAILSRNTKQEKPKQKNKMKKQ